MNTLPEVPARPLQDEMGTRRLLQEMRNQLLKLQAAHAPASAPTNFRVTAVAGGNLIQFTRSDGDGYTLYWSPSVDFSEAAAVDLGLAAQYTDNIGAGSVTRNYWIQARRVAGAASPLVGPIAGTSLALTTATTVPPPPPSNSQPRIIYWRGYKIADL